MAKQIYILHACDTWKGNATPIFYSTSKLKLKTAIQTCIAKDEMNYFDGDEDISIKEQLALFNRDWETEDSRTICDRLQYGYFEIADDGELF